MYLWLAHWHNMFRSGKALNRSGPVRDGRVEILKHNVPKIIYLFSQFFFPS